MGVQRITSPIPNDDCPQSYRVPFLFPSLAIWLPSFSAASPYPCCGVLFVEPPVWPCLVLFKDTYFCHSSPPFSFMPSPPVFSKKPPTAPRAVLALLTPVPADPLDYTAQLNGTVKRNEAGVITAVLRYPAFASALLGYISSAKSLPFPLAADRARYLGFLNLVSTCPHFWLPYWLYFLKPFFPRPFLTNLIFRASLCRLDFSSP